jgi:hypothetical protein
VEAVSLGLHITGSHGFSGTDIARAGSAQVGYLFTTTPSAYVPHLFRVSPPCMPTVTMGMAMMMMMMI